MLGIARPIFAILKQFKKRDPQTNVESNDNPYQDNPYQEEDK